MTGSESASAPATAPRSVGLPRRQLSVWQAVSVCVGMVIGAGIFKTTPLAALNTGSELELLLLWLLGGAVSLIGALCFAELAAAFPDAGGDYYFLRRAFGERLGFLFAWSRFAVIHTGSMALLAFVFGDYVSAIVDLGAYGSTALAAGMIVLLAAVNLAGIRFGIHTQVGLMLIVLAGLISVIVAGIGAALSPGGGAAPPPAVGALPQSQVGVALIFVFLAYGGWSDAATLSAEMRDARRGIQRALLIGLALVTVLYVLVNWAFLQGLGLSGLARSEAPAADLMLQVFGPTGQLLIVSVVAITSITVMNAILIAGARTTYAAARDLGGLTRLAHWHETRGTPPASVVAIATVALALVALGTYTRGGFSTMVDYLTPVYWFFLALSGTAVIVLRRTAPEVMRPFRVPFYPVLPVVFVLCSLYVLYSSLVYVSLGAVVGIAVLAVGLLLLALRSRWTRRHIQRF